MTCGWQEQLGLLDTAHQMEDGVLPPYVVHAA